MFGARYCVASPENLQPLADAWPTTSPSGRSSMIKVRQVSIDAVPKR